LRFIGIEAILFFMESQKSEIIENSFIKKKFSG
jgi:hypothetical protein